MPERAGRDARARWAGCPSALGGMPDRAGRHAVKLRTLAIWWRIGLPHRHRSRLGAGVSVVDLVYRSELAMIASWTYCASPGAISS
jgi:hypothetical protein